jgi:hypothetical protein
VGSNPFLSAMSLSPRFRCHQQSLRFIAWLMVRNSPTYPYNPITQDCWMKRVLDEKPVPLILQFTLTFNSKPKRVVARAGCPFYVAVSESPGEKASLW